MRFSVDLDDFNDIRLPCRHLGDSEPSLRRITPVLEDTAVPLRLITHADLRHVRRIAMLTELLSARLRRQAARFEGRFGD